MVVLFGLKTMTGTARSCRNEHHGQGLRGRTAEEEDIMA